MTRKRLVDLFEWHGFDEEDLSDQKYDKIARQIHAENCGYKELIDWDKIVENFCYNRVQSYGQVLDAEELKKALSRVQEECEKGCCNGSDD